MAELSSELEKRFGVRVDEDVLGVETVANLPTTFVQAEQQA